MVLKQESPGRVLLWRELFFRQQFWVSFLIAEDGEDKIEVIAILGLIDPHLTAMGFHHIADKVVGPSRRPPRLRYYCRDTLPQR